VINATSAGLVGTSLTLPAAVMHGAVAYDMSYGAAPSAFLRWAEASGAAAVHQGWGMLVEQAAESFYLWRGLRPETAPLLSRAGELAPVRTPD
ncbi:MAG: shikimate dehydrogenase, partial [Pseudomonadota bacterium]